MDKPEFDHEVNLGDVSPTSQEKPTRAQVLRRALKYLLFAVIALIIIAVIFVVYNLSKLSVNPFDLGSMTRTNGRTNILVLGIGDPGHAGENLSDTIMLISIDHQSHQVAMISVPRDLRVNIPGYGFAKVNQANSDGGPKLAEQTLANTLGVPIHYYVKTDFAGLKDIVDAVGGIDITVTEELYDPEYPCADDENRSCGIDIKPGTYHMDGAQALQYSRCRKGTCGNDFGRAARQQEVITKLRDKVSQSSFYMNPKEVAGVLTALRAHSETDMSVNNLIQMGYDLHHAKQTIRFVFSDAPGGLLTDSRNSSDLLPADGDYSAMQNLAQNIFTSPPITSPAP
jgi:LCP family protein required for cell wall assembly